MKKSIEYKITFDETQNRATFEDIRRKEPLYRGAATFEDIAEMYRFIACYFLEMAHYMEHNNTFDTPPIYTSGKEWEQLRKMMKGWYHDGFIHTEEE